MYNVYVYTVDDVIIVCNTVCVYIFILYMSVCIYCIYMDDFLYTVYMYIV